MKRLNKIAKMTKKASELNELYIPDAYLYFPTLSNNVDEAVDELLNAIEGTGVELCIGSMKPRLRDPEGNDID